MALNSIEEIIADIRDGKMVILMDDEDRENEGDIIVASEKVTPDIINFMATEARGLICLTLTGERCDYLGLPSMVAGNGAKFSTPFTVSIEAAEGVTTGISAADRAATILAAVNPMGKPDDIVQPGHIFPLRARDGGVLVRAGHTEAAVDISRLAGLNPAGVICEIMKEDGSMARLPDLIAFAQLHGLKIGTISDLIAYRRRHDNLVKVRHTETITSEFGGEWQLRIYADETQGAEHIALIKGDIETDEPVLVRMHAMDPMLDVVGVGPNGRRNEFGDAMKLIADEGRGVLVLLRDVHMKLDATEDASPQTLRQYGLGAQILSSVVFGQTGLHSAFGGVVPEIAARAHTEKLDLSVREALQKAELDLSAIDAIAVTSGPGLIGGVLAGVMCAKGICAATGLPLVGVNHLAGHALTPRLTDAVAFPYLMLLVSGGHCQFLICVQ